MRVRAVLRKHLRRTDRNCMETTTATSFKKHRPIADERRRSSRVPHIIEAWLWSPTAKETNDRMEAVSINLSRNGVGFCVPRSLPTGAYYVIQIGFGDQKLISEVCVLSCRQIPEGLYEVGAEFC